MNTLLLPPVLALALLPASLFAQNDEPTSDRKVRIEITTTENGTTSRTEREFDLSDAQSLQQALDEMGVLKELSTIGPEEELIIDLRRLGEADVLKGMELALSHEGFSMDHEPRGYLGAYLGLYNDMKRTDKDRTAKDDKVEGIVLTKVIEGTPAAKAGLKDGDVVVELDGEAAGTITAFTRRIRAHAPGEVVELTCLRDGKKMKFKATLGVQPMEDQLRSGMDRTPFGDGEEWNMEAFQGAGSMAGAPRSFLGVTPAEDTTADTRGAMIGAVEPGSAAERMGIHPGDVITRIGKRTTTSFGELSAAVQGMQPGEDITVELLRQGEELTLQGKLGERPGQGTWSFNGRPEIPQVRRFNRPMPPMDRASFQDEIERIQDRLDALRDQLDQQGSLSDGARRELRIKVEALPLSPEEKDLLKRKGVANLDQQLELEGLELFPNPAYGPVHLRFAVAARGDLAVDLHNAAGERVYHETITDFSGSYDRTIDLGGKAPGTYYVVIAQNGRTLLRKLVKP